MKNLDNIDHILGIPVYRDREFKMIILYQLVYINRFYNNYSIENHYLVSTYIDKYESWTGAAITEPKTHQLEYQKRIESLIYTMTSTRPDIAFTVGILSQFSYNLYVIYQVPLD